MKALTLTQPWATLVAYGFKTVETRSWRTNYRGQIAIHAAKTFPDYAQSLCMLEPFYSTLKLIPGLQIIWSRINNVSDFPLGAILATVWLGTIEATDVSKKYLSDRELAFGDYSTGRFAWHFNSLRMFDSPIPAKGHLGLWNWSEEA